VFEPIIAGGHPMPTRRVFVLLAASALFSAVFLAPSAYAQDDSQSLGDAARQARLQKQQKDAPAKDASAPSSDTPNKDAQTKAGQSKDASSSDATAKDAPPPKAHRVITNEELPSHVGPSWTSATTPQTSNSSSENNSAEQPISANANANAEQWKSQIQTQKSTIASLESQIATLNDSIHYAGGNCVSNCVQWNERQKEKQDQVETMKGQLEQEQKHLEDLQESARKQGFGSSVYEP
jgi:pentapeptide MXKDX repeat protein